MAPPQPSGLSPPPPMVQSPEVGQQPVYSPPSTSTVLVVKLVCKALTAVLIFISFIILVTNNTSDLIEFACTGAVKYVKFYEVSAYRYMLFIIILALVYSLLQTAFSIFHITSQKRVHKGLTVLDFYGDLVLLYALATAAAAGFGATVDLRREISGEVLNEFFGKGNATSGMLFFASICTAVSLVLSK